MGKLKHDQIIGLDIGASSIKLAQFKRSDDGVHLVKLSLGEVSDLKRLLQDVDRERAEIIVSINCPKTMVKTIAVPYMPKLELAEAIKLEAKNYFSFPINDCFIDFEILSEFTENGIRKYQLAVAVSPEETVNRYLSLLEQLNIKLTALIPAPYALRNLISKLSPNVNKAVTSFLDIGSNHTELMIFKGSDLLFSRKILVTGSDFTQSLTGELASERGKVKLSLEEAENIKREIGIPEAGQSRIIAGKISTTQILSVLMSSLEQLVNEINMCFDYLREDSGSNSADTLVLLGAGSSLKGLTGFLSERLGLEVKVGFSLDGLKIDPDILNENKETWPQFALALGAAFTGAKKLNLLPPEIKDKDNTTSLGLTLEIIASSAIVVAIIIYITMRFQVSALDKKIAALNSEFSSLQPRVKAALTQNLSNSVLGAEPYWGEVFKELSNTMPGNIRLTGLSMENKVIRIKGSITAKEGVDQLSNFILTLEKGIFKNVKLVTAKESVGKEVREFELTAWVD